MRGVWGKCSPELAEHDGLVGEGGEASTAANRRRRARGSGEVLARLASSGVLVVFNWRGGTMKSPVARLLDKVALLGDVGGHVSFTAWRRRRSVVVELGEGAREGGSGGVEWSRGALVLLRTRLGGSGRAGGDLGVLGVLKQLGGIPPSSLGARGGRRQGEGGAGPAGPSPWATGRLFFFFICLFNLSLLISFL